MSLQENKEYIKIDNIFICEVNQKKLNYIENEFEILENIKNNEDITLLFNISMGQIHKLIKHDISKNEKKLFINKEVNNFIIFDFIFFVFLYEDENSILLKDQSYEELEESFDRFVDKLFKYRKGVVLNKTFNVKQRRISRKQLQKMQLEFDKWEQESIF